jgi:hypothetical protein
MRTPTEIPKNIYEVYDLLCYPQFEDETFEQFEDRHRTKAEFDQQLSQAGLTLDHLAGVLMPNLVRQTIEVPRTELWTFGNP